MAYHPLKPLHKRFTEDQLDRRQYRINARRRAAIAIGVVAQTRDWVQRINRSVWTRLRFVLTGRVA